MSLNTVTQQEGWALFLDVDGTLLEVAETPELVYVPHDLKSLLSGLSTRLDGALALISGRTLADLDKLFSPLRFCASGVHGAERRDAAGRVLHPSVKLNRLAEARDELAGFVAAHPGLLLEDKMYAVAVHFRLVPHLEDAVRSTVQTIVSRLGSDYVLQAGKCVFEVRPGAWTKGTAIRMFLSQAPFLGRTPIFIGDDVTDEDAFSVVNEFDGISVRVGDSDNTKANFRLPSVAAVHDWLREIPPPPVLARGA
jgi:trehalose 6-phosphate phosphatase